MNIRFDDFKVEEGIYVPEIGKTYPQDDSTRSLLSPVFTREETFDEHYPYLDESPKYKWNNWIGHHFVLRLVYLVNHIRNGVRFEGRENLKKYKNELSGGAITIANHCNYLDCPAVLEAVHAKPTVRIPMYHLTFLTNVSWYLKAVGGIPVPFESMAAMKKYNEAFDEFHRRGYWFHVFPESSRWDGYKPLRPFFKGAFTMAYKYEMPLLPCVIKFRERKGIYRLFAKKDDPLLTVVVGTPVFPDKTTARQQDVNRMREECFNQMLKMAGITHNTWSVVPPNEK